MNNLESKTFVLSLKEFGKITATVTPVVKKIISEKITQKSSKLIVDFTDVAYIDSTGLAMLLSTYRQMIENDSEMELVNVGNEVMKVLEMMKLNTILTIK